MPSNQCQLVVDLSRGRHHLVASCSGCSELRVRTSSWDELGRAFAQRVSACRTPEQDPDTVLRRAAKQS